ncbi:MAG: translocation/assembly module TamB domain-containing protein [Pseudomonadota bacterium]
MISRRRILRIGIGILIGLCAMIILARLLLQTSLGHSLIERTVAGIQPAGQMITVESLSGDPLGAFAIGRVTVADEDGIWLTADDLTINWRGLAILRRRIDVASLEIGGIDVLRQPKLATGSNTGDGSASELPVKNVDIGNAAIERLTLGNELVPGGADLALTLAMSYGAPDGHVDFALIPLAGPDDRISADFAWSHDQDATGELSIIGAKNGWLGSSLGFSSSDEFSVEAKVQGTPDGWLGNGGMVVNGDQAATLSAQREDDAVSLSAEMGFDLIPALQEIGRHVGPKLEANSEILIHAPGTYGLTLHAQTAVIGFDVDGPVELDDGEVRSSGLAVLASVTDLSTLVATPNLTSDTISLTGEITATRTTDIAFHGDFHLSDLMGGGVHVQSIAGPVRMARAGSTIAATIDLKGILDDASNSSVGALLGDGFNISLEASADLDAGDFELTTAGIESNLLSADIHGNTDHIGGAFDLALSPFGLGADTRANGDLSIGIGEDQTITTEVSAKLLGGDIAGWGGLTSMDDPLSVFANIAQMPDGRIDIQNLTATRTGLALDFSESRIDPDGDVLLNGQATLDALVNPEAGAEILNNQLDVRIAGRLDDDLQLDLGLQSDTVSIGTNKIQNIDVQWIGGGPIENWQSVVQIRADSEAGPLTLDAAPAMRDGAWSTGNIKGDMAGLRLTGSARGQLESPEALAADLALVGTAPGDLPLSDISANLDVDGQVLHVDLSAKHRALSGFQAGDVEVNIDGGLNDEIISTMTWTSAFQTPDGAAPIALALSGRSDFAKGLHALNVDGHVDSLPFETPTPFMITQSADGWVFEGSIAALDGHITLAGEQGTDTLSGDVAIVSLLIGDLAETFLGQSLRGAVSGASTIRIAPSQRVFDLKVALEDFSDADRNSPPIRADLISLYTDGIVGTDLSIVGSDLNLTGRSDISLDWTEPTPSIDPSAQHSWTLFGTGDISSISTLLSPPDTIISGQVDLDLTGQFASDTQSIVGMINLVDGTVEQGDIGVALENIQVMTRLDGDQLLVDQFHAEDGDGGQLSGRGDLALNGSGQGRLTLVSDSMRWISRDDVTAELSGNILAERIEDRIRVAADMSIDRADIDLDRLPATMRPTLPVRFKDDPPPEAAEPALVELDIKINSDGQIFADGLGLDAELSMDAQITGGAEDPQIRGEANIVRGNYTFATQRFDFVDSTVLLRPGDEPVSLDIRAEREDADVTAIVEISGTPDRPVIELSSQPSLPEDEILARVLFGASPTELTPVQAARLASTLASLAGGGGFDVLGNIESALFLDRIDLTETVDGAAVLSTGKFVAPNVYVEVQNQSDGVAGVSVEWEPFNNISVAGETDSEGGQEISLRWARDFDRIRNKRSSETGEGVETKPLDDAPARP